VALSLKPESRGQLLWIKQYEAPPDNATRYLRAIDPVNRVIIFLDKETFKYSGYSLDTETTCGQQLHQQTSLTSPTSTQLTDPFSATVAYGKLYNSGFAGVLYCYDTKNGDLLWAYGDDGETFGGLQTPWGNYPLFIANIADEKVFLFSGEHSPATPLYKGQKVRAVDAITGEELWTLLGSMGYPPRMWYPVAEGFIAYNNMYDGQIHCIGKGPAPSE